MPLKLEIAGAPRLPENTLRLAMRSASDAHGGIALVTLHEDGSERTSLFYIYPNGETGVKLAKNSIAAIPVLFP